MNDKAIRRRIIGVLFIWLLTACDQSSVDILEKNSQDNIVIKEDFLSPIQLFKSRNSEKNVLYTLMADIDGDLKVESFAVTGDLHGCNPILWYVNDEGKGSVIVDAKGTNFKTCELVNSGEGKHIALMGYYEPSNTQLWVVQFKNNQAKVIFEFMADWDIRIIPNGFQAVWKKYHDPDVGGYDLIGENYMWDKDKGTYTRIAESN